MQIRCTNCGTQFKLDDKRIPSGGARAKCSICSTMVVVPPPTAVASDDAVFFAHTGPERSADEVFHQGSNDIDEQHASDPEQRDVMWHITQELFRIRESLEKQQSALATLSQRVAAATSHPEANGDLHNRIEELTAALKEAKDEIERLRSKGQSKSVAVAAKKSGPFSGLFRRRF